MYNGTAKPNSGFNPKTGLAAFKLMLVNPTKEEISELFGREYPFDPNYDIREDLNEDKVRPIEFWVKSETCNVIDKVTFQIGTVSRKSKTGNVQVVNQKGIMRYAPSVAEANIKYEKNAPFIRETTIGEEALYRFMQCAMGYKYNDPEANFMEDSEKGGVTPDKLFNGDVTGLRNFIEYVNSKQRKVGLVLGVKQKDKLDDNGNKYIQNRQVILNQPDFFFTLASGKVEQYNLGKLKEVIDEKRAANISLGSALFSIDLKDFNKEDCINDTPSNPVSQNSWAV